MANANHNLWCETGHAPPTPGSADAAQQIAEGSTNVALTAAQRRRGDTLEKGGVSRVIANELSRSGGAVGDSFRKAVDLQRRRCGAAYRAGTPRSTISDGTLPNAAHGTVDHSLNVASVEKLANVLLFLSPL
jgi:hypothetical protein